MEHMVSPRSSSATAAPWTAPPGDLKSQLKWVGVLAAAMAPCSGCSEAAVLPVGSARSCLGVEMTEINFLEQRKQRFGGWPNGNVVNLPLYRACREAQCAFAAVSGGE